MKKSSVYLAVLALGLLTSVNANAVSLLVCPSCSASGLMLCAPEVKEGNLAATERVLTEMSKNELAHSAKLKSFLTATAKLPADQKMSAYLKMVGATTDAEIAEFVGSRDGRIESKYINTFAKNADLNSEESEVALTKVSESLLGVRK